MDASHVYVRAWRLGCFHSVISTHTPSIAFRHLPPNSARFGYATEGALFISVQCPPARSAPSESFYMTVEATTVEMSKHARKHEAHPPRVKKEFSLDSNDFGVI